MDKSQDHTEQVAPDLQQELEDLRLLRSISEDFNSSLDLDELLPKVFNKILDVVNGQGGSLWLAEGDELRCVLTLGAASDKLLGTTMPVGEGFVGDVARKQRSTLVTHAMEDERFRERVDRTSMMLTTTLIAAPMVTRGNTVGAIQVTNKRTSPGIFEERDRRLLEAMASSAAVALRNAQLHEAEKKARDLSLLLEISREITATLDIDSVLEGVVNHAARALQFDNGAVATARGTSFDIRAIAGQEEVDPQDARVRALSRRGAWAMARGEPFHLVDTESTESDSTRAFMEAFAGDLRDAEVRSALYLPLADEQGSLGILMFESKTPDAFSEPQRELASILANQTAVALRNAELYNQVPMADVLGSLTRRKRQLMQIPKRRLQIYAVIAVAAIALATLVQWPLRVAGHDPSFRPLGMLDVRPLVDGVVERVVVAEGDVVAAGTPVAYLRDFDLRSRRETLAAELEAARRAASRARSFGDLAAEQIHLAEAAAIQNQVGLVDEQLAGTVVRAPVGGTVLTPRPEEQTGQFLEAGDPLLRLGRTDSVEIVLGIPQYELGRMESAEVVRFRVTSVPQRTFEADVREVAPVPYLDGDTPYYEVRAVAENVDGMLRPGMTAHARVLTAPASLAHRAVRAPARILRLLWWRIRP